MKFLTRINRNYLLLFSFSLLIISFAGYFILKQIILNDTKENLLSQKMLIVKQIENGGTLPVLKPIVEVKPVTASEWIEPGFREIQIFDSLENEQEPYLEYSGTEEVNGQFYLIKIREASLESEDLALSIGASIFVLLLVAFGISLIINRQLNKTIWFAFEQNLIAIEQFDFTNMKRLGLQPSSIEEFDRLNKVVNNLTEKLQNDYRMLKEFTENASHEIQSPIAIALLNLDELLQQELSEEAFKKVVTAVNAMQRLSSLNQNLLLLTKIENHQFKSSESIGFTTIIQQKIEEFEPLLKGNNLEVNYTSISEFRVMMNPLLAGILINNLMSNAVNHNQKNGSINIRVEADKMVFCNSGPPNVLTNETIFKRFVKGQSKSHGLGLSIVKQICDSCNLEIQYDSEDEHCFIISKLQKKNDNIS